MCERACVVALSASDRFTYLFTDLPIQESPEASLKEQYAVGTVKIKIRTLAKIFYGIVKGFTFFINQA